MELLGDRGAAGDPAPLKHPDRQTRARQVAGAGETVVTGADDGDIVLGGAGAHSR